MENVEISFIIEVIRPVNLPFIQEEIKLWKIIDQTASRTGNTAKICFLTKNHYLHNPEKNIVRGPVGPTMHPTPLRLFFIGANLFVSVYWVVFNNVPMKKLIWAMFIFTVSMATPFFLTMTRSICINSFISWSVLTIEEQTWYQNVAKTLVFNLHMI